MTTVSSPPVSTCHRCKVRHQVALGIYRASRSIPAPNGARGRTTEFKYMMVKNIVCPICNQVQRRDIENDSANWRDSVVG